MTKIGFDCAGFLRLLKCIALGIGMLIVGGAVLLDIILIPLAAGYPFHEKQTIYDLILMDLLFWLYAGLHSGFCSCIARQQNHEKLETESRLFKFFSFAMYYTIPVVVNIYCIVWFSLATGDCIEWCMLLSLLPVPLVLFVVLQLPHAVFVTFVRINNSETTTPV